MWEMLKEWIPIIADDYVWGWGPELLGGLPLMVILLLGTGIILTLVTGLIQVRRFKTASSMVLRGAFKKDESEEEGDITPFQALMTALSATVGNGNIAGVASAIALGGPGAAFWMWITAVFGMATKYAEAVLGVKYRKVAEDGSMAGGPMYYCEYGIRPGFMLTEQSLENLKSDGVPASLVEKLKSMKNEKYKKNEFKDLVKGKIGEDHFITYESLIFEHAIRIGGKLGRGLGIFFAICGTIACLIGTGNMFQTNSMAVSVATQLAEAGIISGGAQTTVAQGFVGAIVTILVGMVIIGGVKRIAQVAEKLVPTMIVLYFASAIIIILWNITAVPSAIALIFQSAFTPTAALGGAVGIGIQQAIRYGVARGILSNESGLGSAPIAHGAAKTKSPIRQGQIAMMGTFIDTIIVCSLTAIMITVTGAYLEGPLYKAEGALESIDMTMFAFSSVIRGGGTVVVGASLLFGISTLLGWCYYGEKCLEYLAGIRIKTAYRIVFITLMFLGSLPSQEGIRVIVKIGDIGNAFMAFPNLLALLLLAKEVGRITREHLSKATVN
ncbi:MAG: alanine/glycine:cation symporter family protein [bacterium]